MGTLKMEEWTKIASLARNQMAFRITFDVGSKHSRAGEVISPNHTLQLVGLFSISEELVEWT